MKKKYIGLLLGFFLLFTTGCENNTKEGTIEKMHYQEIEEVSNYVKIDTSKGIILVELYEDIAPITVENFQNLVKNNFYDNLIFHRVVSNFVIQTGSPNGLGTDGSGKTIKGEFKNNGVENNLSHTRGVISMARSELKDSASSQFFIVVQDATYLDGDYAAFGRVIAGMDTLDKIAQVEVDYNDKPTVDQKIKSIRFVKVGD